jgi:hypothetical protein
MTVWDEQGADRRDVQLLIDQNWLVLIMRHEG